MENNKTENNNISFFKSLIPQKVSNDLVISFYEFLRKISFHNFEENLEKNKINFQNHIKEIEKNNGYIENQHEYTDIYYGKKTISYCGCEIIATYNSIYDLTGRHDISFPDMINSFEKDGIVLSGEFGTAPKAIEDYLKKQGFKTKSSTKKEEYDKIGILADALILTIYNDKYDIFHMIHSFNITKRNGKFYIHNNGYQCYLKPYLSITDLLNRINKEMSKDIFLIGIFKN